DIISLNVLGNDRPQFSHKAVSEFFDKRGSNYSVRPDMPMIVDLMGWDWAFALMCYGPHWKEHWRVFPSHFNHSVAEHQEIQIEISGELLTLLKTSDSHVEHVRHSFPSLLAECSISYGHTVVIDDNDPYVRLVDEGLLQSTSEAVPGAFLSTFSRVVRPPYVGGSFRTEFCWLNNATGKGEILTEELIKDSPAAVAYAAGADTSVSTLTTFFLAMTLYPEAQKRAQAELDVVVTVGGRLPTFSDKDTLPYVMALMKEVLRWIPVLPMAVPHRAVNPDQYKGYPAGASVLGNTWAILHDANVFVGPEKFEPERFIDRNLPDPADSGVFGFGRRKSMALDTIWIVIVSVLFVYNISKVFDSHGNMITPLQKYPASFKCHIEPRSRAALALIQHVGMGRLVGRSRYVVTEPSQLSNSQY
ncbi:cytochrome P450, partial [Lactarius sanguifluus]